MLLMTDLMVLVYTMRITFFMNSIMVRYSFCHFLNIFNAFSVSDFVKTSGTTKYPFWLNGQFVFLIA